MSGIHLRELPMRDMVDVLHFLFEEDNTYTSEEQMQSKLKMRERVYRDLYDIDYKYKLPPSKGGAKPYEYDMEEPLSASTTQNLDDLPSSEGVTPFSPKARKPGGRKKPPTLEEINAKPFNPDAFTGGFLSEPLG